MTFWTSTASVNGQLDKHNEINNTTISAKFVG